ncbi:MAG: S8 family serine peptidase [Asgard group archaeon]|nr:S8 family serine peptidase [Asgard group archaeon]
MRKGRILGICLLFVLSLSTAIPFVVGNIEYTNSSSEPLILEKTVLDINGDKIEDKLMTNIEKTDNYFIDVVVEYEHPISYMDIYRLVNIGANCDDRTWDLGRRMKITLPRSQLETVAKIPGIKLVHPAEQRFIVVAIEGSDYSELSKLEQEFNDVEIFWNIGCALVRDYSGIEHDIKNTGTFNLIADVTDSRHHFTSAGNSPDYHLDTISTVTQINGTYMWDKGYTGTDIKVGILDTGINSDHAAIFGRVGGAESFIHPDYGHDYEDPSTEDTNGHGSHCTGIIAGDGAVTEAYKGMAPNALVYMARVAEGSEDYGIPTPAILAGIDWVVTRNVVVISFSIGGGDAPGNNAIETAFKNIIKNEYISVAAAAGNSGDSGTYHTDAPGAEAEVISVGSIDSNDNIVGYSGQGPNADNEMKPDILAPGLNIISFDNVGDGYVSMSGTSMATPHIAGAVALLIEACIDRGINYNPGSIKAALLQTGVFMSSKNILQQGRGIADVGSAYELLRSAQKDGNRPIIGACNPINNPVPFWETLLQGQNVQQSITCISPFANDSTTIEITGEASSYLTVDELVGKYSKTAKVWYAIPENATTGTVTGQFIYKINDFVLDTANIQFTIVESNGKNILLHYKKTSWGTSHSFGQYNYFTQDALDHGYAVSEPLTDLTSDMLDAYDFIWMPDPFDLQMNAFGEIVSTYGEFTNTELDLLHDYVVNKSGTVFFDFNGLVFSADYQMNLGTNVSVINQFTESYGIHVRETVWTSENPVMVETTTHHALTAEVEGIDHFGCSIELSGNAIGLTDAPGSGDYPTLAVSQTESGGRIIVLCTNFAIDYQGFNNGYNGGTNNDKFSRNLVRWGCAENRIERVNIQNDSKTINMTYDHIKGTDEFGGYVILPNATQVPLEWQEIAANQYKSSFTATESGLHKIYVEVGESGADEFDYYEFTANIQTPTDTGGLTPIVVVLLSAFGLASWYLLSKRRK